MTTFYNICAGIDPLFT
jgi:adenylate kinase family enzyme/YHS domain-containing protein